MRTFFLGIFLSLVVNIAHADLTLRDLDNNTFSFSSLKGNWVFINYWASWCSPCVAEIAQFNRFYKKNKNKNVRIFAVNFDQFSLHKQRALAKQFNILYPSLNPSSLHPLHLDHPSVVPVTYVFNPEGKHVDTLYGGQTARALNEAMR